MDDLVHHDLAVEGKSQLSVWQAHHLKEGFGGSHEAEGVSAELGADQDEFVPTEQSRKGS